MPSTTPPRRVTAQRALADHTLHGLLRSLNGAGRQAPVLKLRWRLRQKGYGWYITALLSLKSSGRILVRVKRPNNQEKSRYPTEENTMRLRWVGFLLCICLTASALAMEAGPTLILRCPDSDELVKLPTLASGSPFRMCQTRVLDAKCWSDEFVMHNLLLKTPRITRCGDKGQFFWTYDATEVNPGSLVDEKTVLLADARHVRSLSEQEYLEAIDQGMGRNYREEVYLRAELWWAANKIVRNSKTEVLTSPFSPGSKARKNLERLVELLTVGSPDKSSLKPRDDEPLMRAEALRQLGRFDEARQVLQATFPKRMEEEVRWIRELVDKGDVLVREVPVFQK